MGAQEQGLQESCGTTTERLIRQI